MKQFINTIAGEYQIMVKVVDVFGNNTNEVIKTKIGGPL